MQLHSGLISAKGSRTPIHCPQFSHWWRGCRERDSSAKDSSTREDWLDKASNVWEAEPGLDEGGHSRTHEGHIPAGFAVESCRRFAGVHKAEIQRADVPDDELVAEDGGAFVFVGEAAVC